MKEHIFGSLNRYTYSVFAVLMALGIVLSSLTTYYADCCEVREEVLRLHVIANSDSAADQAVKLKVRDALLTSGADIFDGSVNAKEATKKITPALSRLREKADAVLRENGMDYQSEALIVTEYFDTRAYEDITLPAGYYTALKVVLGEGEGQNWWCVMFPPLCLPSVSVSDADDAYAVFRNTGAKVVQAENGYCIRFKVAELTEKAVRWVRQRLARENDGGKN